MKFSPFVTPVVVLLSYNENGRMGGTQWLYVPSADEKRSVERSARPANGCTVSNVTSRSRKIRLDQAKRAIHVTLKIAFWFIEDRPGFVPGRWRF
jgi:hypothetical protein